MALGPSPNLDKIHRHVRIVAFLFLAFSAFWVLLAGWFVWAGGPWEWDSLGFAFSFWFIVAAFPLLIAGWGLLRLRRWARVLAMVLAAIALVPLFPIGTPFGVYALWVLFSDGAKTIFSPEI